MSKTHTREKILVISRCFIHHIIIFFLDNEATKPCYPEQQYFYHRFNRNINFHVHLADFLLGIHLTETHVYHIERWDSHKSCWLSQICVPRYECQPTRSHANSTTCQLDPLRILTKLHLSQPTWPRANADSRQQWGKPYEQASEFAHVKADERNARVPYVHIHR